MKYICFSILGKTLCGKEDEPVPEHLADSRRFCNECVQVMWKEQYRRSVLAPLTKRNRHQEGTEGNQKRVEVTVEEPRLVPPRPIKSLRHYMKVKA
jgi:hypothetical protein